MAFDDSAAVRGGVGSFLSPRDAAATATAAGARPRIQHLGSVLEATGGVVPSLPWLQQASDAVMVMVPAVHNHRGGDGNEADVEQVDAVFAQVLHHDLRCVVDRPRPSHAALTLRNEISRSLAANPAAVQGRGGGQHVAVSAAEAARRGGNSLDDRTSSSCRLLVQLEEVVNVALSNEARMQRDVHNDPATNSNSHSSSSSSGSRCLKLQLVDGYQHPLQPRHDSASNTQAPSLTSSAIVAMEMSPIPNLTDQTMAGTKLLLTIGDGETFPTTNGSASSALRVSHGVLLLTPQNCVVMGGHVPELAAEQARQRKALHDQSGASITDPTIRALVSHNYMTDGANADDDEGAFFVAYSHICFLHALTGSTNAHPSS
jgi:RecQ mediated genome instability protein